MQRVFRLSWFAVLLVTMAASLGAYAHLRRLNAHYVQSEIAHRSQDNFSAIRAIFKQHLDASAAIAAFLMGETRTGAYMEGEEAQAFARNMLDTHPDELTAVAIIPPEGSGEAQTISRDGTGRFDPPLNWPHLRGLARGGVRRIFRWCGISGNG